MATTATTASELILAIDSTIRQQTARNSITPTTHSGLLDNMVQVLSAVTVTSWSAGTGTNSAVLIGGGNISSGVTSVAEGTVTIAGGDYSHSEGISSKAYGDASHSEGQGSIASGFAGHAEGGGTLASGYYSHSEGYQTTASNTYTHAGGSNSIASGLTSFIHSTNSLVTGDRSVVLGGQNITGATDDTVYVPNLHATSIPSYNDDTAAGVGGLSTGAFYQTTGSGAAPLNAPGILMIKQ